MPRKKREYDSNEVTEIIELRLKELNGVISKLSYNGVCNLNKKIAKNSEYKRKNGKLFNLYPYDFWAGKYNGIENYGKKQIDSIKENHQTEYLSGIFDPNLQDVLLAINDLHNNPVKLSYVLTNIFKKDKQKIQSLEKENQLLKTKNKNLKTTLENTQQAIYNIFYNSKSTKNSLINIFELKKSQDGFMKEQISNAFLSNTDLLEKLLTREDEATIQRVNIIEINREKRKSRHQNLNL